MLNTEQIKLLEKPFEKDEHGVVQNNPYILKSAIRRRLWQVDPNYQLGAPELVTHDQDVIVLRGTLTIGDVTHYGVGTGLIIRTRKDEKTGEVFDLPLYDIARNMAKAYKQAASDILPRAAVQFNCGAYLAEKPKGMSLDALLAKLNGKPQPSAPAQPPQPAQKTEPPATVTAWANREQIDSLVKNAFSALGIISADICKLAGVPLLSDYAAWNTKYPSRKAAADAIKAAHEKPATPKQPSTVT